MSTRFAFMGKVGQVSGFDAQKDASAILILETLLAAYSRIAIQMTTTGIPVLLRPTEVMTEGIRHGRHFFLLPVAGEGVEVNHDVFLLDLMKKDNLESRMDANTGTFKRTTIKTRLTPHNKNRAVETTVINRDGEKLGRVLGDSDSSVQFGVFNLYYIDIKEEQGWRGSDSDTFHMFAIRTTTIQTQTGKRGVSWKYLSFFARPESLPTNVIATAQYLSHLMADNISPQPVMKSVFNQDITMNPSDFKEDISAMISISREAGGVLEPQKIAPDEIRAKFIPPLPTMEDGTEFSDDDFPIVPSVVFVGGEWYAMMPWAYPFAGLLFEYINSIRDALRYVNNEIVEIATLRCKPDYEIVLGSRRDRELIIITEHFVRKTMQHKTTIAIRHSCIARILFGSNTAWQMKRPGTRGEISAPGFGCLDLWVCKEAEKSVGGNLWDSFLAPSMRDGEYHEMIGRSADELDGILFPDSSFFRSFVGKNTTYSEAVKHWINTAGYVKLEREVLETKKNTSDASQELTEADKTAMSARLKEICDNMEKQVRGVYRDALAPYIRLVVAPLVSSVATSGHSGDKDSSNYIPLLQKGHPFSGHTLTSQETEKTNTTKLVYEIANTLYLAVSDIGEYAMVDGGNHLRAKEENIRPPAAQGIILQAVTTTVPRAVLQKAHESIASSAYCPYGYMAHSLWKIADFTDDHIDFFPGMKVDARLRTEIRTIEPRNCSVSRTTLCPAPEKKDTIYATPIEYFVDREELGRNDKLLYLTFLKKLYTKYIYTWSYIHSLIEIQSEGKGGKIEREKATRRNAERMFAFVLARFLRTTVDSGAPNIYELMPYGRLSGDGHSTSWIPDEEVSRTMDAMEGKYRNVFRNFFTNCDEVYRRERLWYMREADRALNAGSLAEEQFTNLDFVNGYLLAENFISDPSSGSPGYLNWKQYLALSASVLYAKGNVNENMTFLKGMFSAARAGDRPSSPGNLTTEGSRFVQKDTITTLNGEEDVLRLFNDNLKVSHTVLVNIANVPVYNENRNLGGGTVVSTLNEALSPRNNLFYILARSLHVKNPDSSYGFEFFHGRPPLPSTSQVNLNSSAQFRHTNALKNAVHNWGGSAVSALQTRLEATSATAPQVYMFGNGGPNVMLSTREADERAASPASSQRQDFNLIAVIRNLIDNAIIEGSDGIARPRYLSKAERAARLIELAARGRGTLSRLPPGSQRSSNKGTYAETVALQRRQLERTVFLNKNNRDSIERESYSAADAERYVQGLHR